jgi:hypothetical protein
MPQVGSEPKIPVFERTKTVHALDPVATVIGGFHNTRTTNYNYIRSLNQCYKYYILRYCVSLWTGVVVTLYAAAIWEVLGSNLGRVPTVPNVFNSGFPQSIETNAGTVPRLHHDTFLPNRLQFIKHPVQSGW